MKVVGLSYEQFGVMQAVANGELAEASPSTLRHLALRGWVRGGRLTEDGRHVLERALVHPPEKPARFAKEQSSSL